MTEIEDILIFPARSWHAALQEHSEALIDSSSAFNDEPNVGTHGSGLDAPDLFVDDQVLHHLVEEILLIVRQGSVHPGRLFDLIVFRFHIEFINNNSIK